MLLFSFSSKTLPQPENCFIFLGIPWPKKSVSKRHISQTIWAHYLMNCARQLSWRVCFLFHIGHLRQGINLSTKNEKSAIRLFFFFIVLLKMICHALFMFEITMDICVWVCGCMCAVLISHISKGGS